MLTALLPGLCCVAEQMMWRGHEEGLKERGCTDEQVRQVFEKIRKLVAEGRYVQKLQPLVRFPPAVASSSNGLQALTDGLVWQLPILGQIMLDGEWMMQALLMPKRGVQY
jgi:hypothetical protein